VAGAWKPKLSGLPLVATRHAGIPEVVLEGENGPSRWKEGDRDGMAACDRPPWPTTGRWRSQLGSRPRPLLSPVHGEPSHREQLMDLDRGAVRADGPPLRLPAGAVKVKPPVDPPSPLVAPSAPNLLLDPGALGHSRHHHSRSSSLGKPLAHARAGRGRADP